MCEEENPFTPRIRNLESSRKTRMPNNVKTYDGMGDPEDHVKNFQAAAQQKKYVKDPVEIHNIKQRDGETIEDFIERFKIETGRMKGDPECMRISGFMHGVNNPELTKRLNEHVPKTMEEMMITTTAFIRREAVAACKKKGHIKGPIFEITQGREGSLTDLPPHQDAERNLGYRSDTDECMQLKKQIEELVRAEKLSHLIKKIKQGRDQSKAGKKETAVKDKPTAIYMVQSWQRTVKQKVTQSFERVGEIVFPKLAANNGTKGPLVIEAEMGGHIIHRMYIDGGSSMEILYEHCFNRLRPEIKSQMVPATTSLTGFSGETIWLLGKLRLLVTIRDATHSTRAWMNFMVVKSMSPYNGIIRRPGLKAIKAVTSTVHGMLKFPVKGGIATICSTILIPAECASEVVIGGSLSDKGRTALCSVLKKNLDIFAWQPSDMTGVPRSVAEHRLNIREGYLPVRQKKSGQAPERAKAIQAEVQKLVDTRIMREVYYHDWLSNPVMVKKHDGSWRMCVDFTNLNKACPQDCYPLPEIVWKVESLCGYPFKCFLDAYKGYHQIQLAEADEEKTAFHIGHGVYCYTKMPFGLKNVGATYQRLMDKAFESQVRRNIEVYVDDLVVKSYIEAEMMRDIDETFRTLRKVNMKLNPKKCSFGLAEGVFLGYVITPEGLKPCPDKTAEVLQLPSPRTIKEVQSLNGKLASLNRFLSKSAENSLPLFQTLKKCIKKSDFRWTAEAEQAFQQLKQEELIMYLSATYGAISAVLMTERGTTQTLIYFISRALQGLELNYSPMEKLVLSLVFAAKRLRRTSVKGQILADFLVEMPGDVSQATPAAVTQEEPRTIFTDGSSCVDGSGAGLILTNPEGVEFTYTLRTFVAKEDNMIKYLETVRGLIIRFTTFSISQVPQSKNKKADALSKIASTSFAHLSKLVEVLENKSIKEKEVATVIEEDGPTWMTQRSFLTSWLRCVGPLQADYVMREIHEGSCSMHAGPRSVVAKAVRLSYYWPTMHKDARDMIRKRNDCQIHRPVTRHPQQSLTPITARWPFYKWGIDIACPFPEGPRKVKFLIVAMDYFTKKGEPKPGERIKARLGEGNKNWVKELSHVLWAQRTMIKSSHGDMPFSLTYRTKAIIPTEIIMPTYRTAAIDVVNNDEELRLNLDLLEERRERAAVCEARAKSKIMKYYKARVRGVAFKPGDFVYRSNDASHAVAGGKLGPKWEGPYEVIEALGNRAYKLRSTDGTVLPRTWNVINLKRCYL
nr:reverse transcriptase domain-containing protein [Tanacetum cinerariifolium]